MEEEIEILKTIYMDDIVACDLESEKPTFEIVLTPSNSENEADNRKNLRLNLVIYFSKKYPNEVPEFQLKGVKGITDEDVLKIKKEILNIGAQNVGSPMIFEIVQFIRDELNSYGNIPKTCCCAICLYDFDEKESVMTLECYHYFHSECLIRHMLFSETEIANERREALANKLSWKEHTACCPICRQQLNKEELEYLHGLHNSSSQKASSSSASFSSPPVVISDKIRKMQKEMKILFDKQKSLGGIIDPDENKQEIIVLNRPPPPTESLNLENSEPPAQQGTS